MKGHSASIQPTMNLDTSAKTLSTQTSLKCSEVDEIIYHDFIWNNKSWSATPTAPYTTSNIFWWGTNCCRDEQDEFLWLQASWQIHIYECNVVGHAEMDEQECAHPLIL